MCIRHHIHKAILRATGRLPGRYVLHVKQENLTFITFPKCACTTLIKWVATTQGLQNQYGISSEHNNAFGYHGIHDFGRKVLRSQVRGISKKGGQLIIVVRNPADRLLSCFFGNYGDETWGLFHSYSRVFDGDFSFLDFVSALDQGRINIYEDAHFRPLTSMLGKDARVELAHAELLSVENLTSRLEEISHRIKCDFDIQNMSNATRLSRTNHTHEDLSIIPAPDLRIDNGYGEIIDVAGERSRLLTPKVVQMIQGLYAKDYELLETYSIDNRE